MQHSENGYSKELLAFCTLFFSGRNWHATCASIRISDEAYKEFEKEYLQVLKLSHKDTLAALKAGNLSDEATATLEKVAKEVSSKY